jgi:hypothetical protein
MFVPAGYTRAGIQMSITSGRPGLSNDPNLNPVGCRVSFFKHDRWVAYVARREGDRFRFRAKLRKSDQRGLWANADQRDPNNARIIGGGKLALGA